MKALEHVVRPYDYCFPASLIAQRPVYPRDAAKLVVYKKGSARLVYATFASLADYLPPRSVLVFNNTRVIPARLMVYKGTGGRVELLYISTAGRLLRCLANRKLYVGTRLTLSKKLYFNVARSDGRFYYLKPSFPVSRLVATLETYGTAPIPPYIKSAAARGSVLRKQYQSIFAQIRGSIAAPTASLHFTPRLMKKLRSRGHVIVFVTLHVGLGTFAPLTEKNIKKGELHEESYSIDPRARKILVAARRENRPIIAVGTTVARTLESAYSRRAAFKVKGSTRLFIRPPYRFAVVDGLITNFHVPRSSLLMFVAAFLTKKTTMELYQKAVKRKFRLFSFGDGMLLLAVKKNKI